MTVDEYFDQFNIHELTINEAQDRIETIRPILNQIVDNYQLFKNTFELLGMVSKNGTPIQVIQQTKYQLDQYEDILGDLRDELQLNDVMLRNWESGFADFPSEKDGKPIWYCFEPHEQNISHYHDFSLGCSWRKAIE